MISCRLLGKCQSPHARAVCARGTDGRLFDANSRTSVCPNLLPASSLLGCEQPTLSLTTDPCPKRVTWACSQGLPGLQKPASQSWPHDPKIFLLGTVGSIHSHEWLLAAKTCEKYLHIPVPALECGLSGRNPSLVCRHHVPKPCSISTAWELYSILNRDQKPLEGIKCSCLVVSAGYVLTRVQAGFPGIQKARRRTDFWPGKWRAGALLALVPAMSPPRAPAVFSWDSSRAVAASSGNTHRQGNAGKLQGDLDLPCCCSAEAFCEERGDDALYRR